MFGDEGRGGYSTNGFADLTNLVVTTASTNYAVLPDPLAAIMAKTILPRA